MTLSVVGMFCEDIREEREGAVSLVGVLPDNISVPGFAPGAVVPKLSLYVRINFGLEEPIKTISLKLVLPDDREISVGPVEDHIIKESYDITKINGGFVSSVVMKVNMSPFPIPKLGWLRAIVIVDGKDFVAANVRFNTEPGKAGSEVVHQAFHRF